MIGEMATKHIKDKMNLTSIGIGAILLISGIDGVFGESSNDITYFAKFVCGTIEGDEGPLRPGHYDTDISIINKQNQEITVIWNLITEDDRNTHSLLQKLEHEDNIAIDCAIIKERLDIQNDESFTRGFVSIHVPTEYNPANPQALIQNPYSSDPLDVHVFFTANALNSLPHEVVYEKISFYILQDGTGLIPDNMIKTTLDVTIPSPINEISNTEDKIKQLLSEKYEISNEQLAEISVRIKDVSLGVGVFIDDHAISYEIVKPRAGLN